MTLQKISSAYASGDGEEVSRDAGAGHRQKAGRLRSDISAVADFSMPFFHAFFPGNRLLCKVDFPLLFVSLDFRPGVTVCRQFLQPFHRLLPCGNGCGICAIAENDPNSHVCRFFSMEHSTGISSQTPLADRYRKIPIRYYNINDSKVKWGKLEWYVRVQQNHPGGSTPPSCKLDTSGAGWCSSGTCNNYCYPKVIPCQNPPSSWTWKGGHPKNTNKHWYNNP